MSDIEIGTSMVRKRIIEQQATDDARILEERKARREELLREARKNPRRPEYFIVTWFRGLRTIRTV
ncbi:MAG: hypothetical protein IH577_04565 [Deltaproteobacteria bacterium]|nr:hypothetical protein [Deltaproteobacteria bacterium]